MIHEFIFMLENSFTGEEAEQIGVLDLSQVLYAYRSMMEVGITVIKFKNNDCATIRIDINDFTDIWRAFTEDIKI